MAMDFYEQLNARGLKARLQTPVLGLPDGALGAVSVQDAIDNCVAKVAYWDDVVERERRRSEMVGETTPQLLSALSFANKYAFLLAELLGKDKSRSNFQVVFASAASSSSPSSSDAIRFRKKA